MASEQLHSGSFSGYNEDTTISVYFYKRIDNSSSTTSISMENDLKFSGVNPVVINYNGSADDIYAPIKTSSCDVNIVSDKILDDLYTAKKDGIYMKVTSKTPYMQYNIYYTNQGSVVSSNTGYDINHSYNIHTKTLFFKDINGAFRFNGKIFKANENPTNVTLMYRGNGTWREDNAWNLNYDDQYFYVGNHSYRTYVDGNGYQIQEWVSGDWGTATAYNVVEGGTTSQCVYGANDIVHFSDSVVELLAYKHRYTWDSANKQWIAATSYQDTDGGDYFAIHGRSYMKVLDNEGNLVDAACVMGYTGNDSTESYWVVKLDRTNNTFTRLFPVPFATYTNLFTDDSGYVYYVHDTGAIYYWSWEINQWFKWITFTGDIRDDSFELDYVIPSSPKMVIIRYKNTSNDDVFFNLTNIQHPVIYGKWEKVPGRYNLKTVFEGYKIPNTYSQEVSLNLDNISMTCIDPLALLKYVTIDKVFTKPRIVSYGELIGKSIAYVKLSGHELYVERNVTYGSDTHTATNNLLNMKCQISNFWNEGGEPATIYSVIEEILRPFCLTLQMVDDKYYIFNQTRTTGSSLFDLYFISDSGTLSSGGYFSFSPDTYTFSEHEWISNNVSNSTIEIGSTYDKVTSVASTSIPEYSNMVYDIVDYNQTDLYDILDMNVQRNKTKGYRRTSFNNISLDTTDAWYYIWNGVYTNEIYHLESYGDYVNGYLNINKAYEYLTGNSGHPADYGSILNFYGGSDNPQGTGKEQYVEKPVEINRRITAYAADNGTPLEFLELSDLDWTWTKAYDPDSGYLTPELNKDNSSSAKFGVSIDMQNSDKITYHQENEMYLSSLEEHTIDLTLTQAYSRTGINTDIDIYQNNTATGKVFDLAWDDDEQKWRATCVYADVDFFPGLWDAAAVKVDTLYFSKYNTSGTILRPIRLQPVWDKRRINMYIELTGGGVLQYNGKDWVSDSAVSNSNSFYLMKMMNGESLYHTDFRYNLIETYDGEHYSLTDERYTYYTDEAGGVTTGSVSGGSSHYCEPYNSESNSWYQWVDSCGEGSLSIKMPAVDDVNAKVVIDVYNSTMLGMTGNNYTSGLSHTDYIYYLIQGQGRYWDDDQQQYVYITLTSNNCVNYNQIGGDSSYVNFMPYNTSYVKAEHLDLNISVSVPESNLGQMFSQSDIKYIINKKKNYVEEFEGPTFQVNTYNNLVSSSYSYIIFDNSVADPGEFVINNIAVRPECYTVQAYMNWLSVIRKIYNKTLVSTDYVRKYNQAKDINNFKTFIISPEVGNNRLMVISDSWDLKSDRHTITAIESQGLDVSTVSSFAVEEIPRKARAERWNLPTAKKS